MAHGDVPIGMDRDAEIVLAPVHYSLIIWGTLYGWLVFDQLPDRWTWFGAAIIVATGLYIMHREWQLARIGRAAAPAEPSPDHDRQDSAHSDQ